MLAFWQPRFHLVMIMVWKFWFLQLILPDDFITGIYRVDQPHAIFQFKCKTLVNLESLEGGGGWSLAWDERYYGYCVVVKLGTVHSQLVWESWEYKQTLLQAK